MNYVIGRGEYHLSIDLARRLICDMHFSEIIQGCIFFSAADPSTLRTWSKDVRTSEHAIDEHFFFENCEMSCLHSLQSSLRRRIEIA